MGNVVNKTLETLAEPSLGNPASDGMVLSSTVAGVRGWVVPGGLTDFTEARNITAPNAIVPAHSIQATGAETDIDLAIVPKGTGAILAQIPDGTAVGGNKRGQYAVDLQTRRTQYLDGSYVASGKYASILGGYGHKATNQYSCVVNGDSNTVSSFFGCVVNGSANTASGEKGFIGNGSRNTVSAKLASVCNGQNLTAYLAGQAIAGCYNASASKVRQDSNLSMQLSTTAATAAEMFIDGAARAVLKNNCAWAFDITILAHSSTNVLHTARFKRSGLILRGATAATTTLEGAVQTIGTDIINTNLAGCDVAISADTTNGSLKVEVTGIASTTIVWQAKIELVEIEI